MLGGIRTGHGCEAVAGATTTATGGQRRHVDLGLRVMLMRRGGREMGRFVQTGYMRDGYMRVMELLRRIGNRMREGLLKVRILGVIRNGIVDDHLSSDGLRRSGGRGGLYRRFRIRELIGYAVIVTVHDGSLLRFRGGTKGILERSNESRLRGGGQRAGGGNGGDGGSTGTTAAGNVRRGTGRAGSGIFASRAMNTVLRGQRWRLASQSGHVIDAIHSRGNRVSCG